MNTPLQKALLTEFMMQAPYQPATNYWRAVEIAEVIAYGLPPGRGLDLGCGDGHLMAIILSHSARATSPARTSTPTKPPWPLAPKSIVNW